MKSGKATSAPMASVIYCLSSVITKAITLITTPIFTRIMTSEEYGKYMLYISLYGICSAAASVGASSGVIYNVFSEEGDKKPEISFAGFIISIPFTAVICTLFFTFSNFLDIPTTIIPILFIHTSLDIFILSYLLKFRYAYKAMTVFFVEIAKAILSVILSYYLVSSTSLGYVGRVLGFIITLIPFAVIALFSFGRSIFSIPSRIMQRVLKNSLPAALSALFLSLGVYSVNILISVLIGKEALATFSIFNTVATAPVFVITALISALAPAIQKEIGSKSTARIKDMFTTSSSIISSIIMIVALASKEALALLAPSSYGGSIFIILPLLLYSQLKLADQFFSCVLNSARIYRYSLISNMLFTLSSLALVILLVNTLGIFAAGLGLCLGVLLSITHKSFHFASLNLSELSFRHVILPFISVFAFSFLALSLAERPALRIILAIIPAVRLLNVYFKKSQITHLQNI